MEDEIHIGKLILETLKEQQRSVAWLAKKVRRDPAHLGRVLKNNTDMHTGLLREISNALQTDFFAFFSEQVKK
jgi:hypothetical protein